MAGTNTTVMCQVIVLSRKGATIISQCMECKMLNIWQRSLLINFTPAQFKSFREFTNKLDTGECMFPFPDGEERMVLRTLHSDICFAFSVDEWDDFDIAMEEAEYMKDIYDLLYG